MTDRWTPFAALIEKHGLKRVIEVAKQRYGTEIQIDDVPENERADLWDSLWWHDYLEDFVNNFDNYNTQTS